MVREVVKGLRRRVGVAQRQVSPIIVEHLRRIVEHLPDTPAGLRDRALLLVGFAGAFRRSELVSLDVADLGEQPVGLVINLRRSKTDQEGAGRKVGIPFGAELSLCPVRALRAWREAAQIDEGPLFRPVDKHGTALARRLSAHSVAVIVKRIAAVAGYDPRLFSGHSLRAGLATAAAAAGKSERAIMRQTGHRSEVMLRRYIRDGELFLENAAEGLL
jgi:integrase